MKIKYQFVTGDSVEIEVPDSIGKVAVRADMDIQNNNRKETRKHKSLEKLHENGTQLSDENADIHSIFEQKEARRSLYKALGNLPPQQRELIQKVFFEGQKMADIAREEGVSSQAVQERLAKIRLKLRKAMTAS